MTTAYIIKETVSGKYMSQFRCGPTMGKLPRLYHDKAEAQQYADYCNNKDTSQYLEYYKATLVQCQKAFKRSNLKVSKAQVALEAANQTGIKSLIKAGRDEYNAAVKELDNAQSNINTYSLKIKKIENTNINYQVFEVQLP